jgi:dihydroxyacetone kinase-like predicted kinase
MLDDHVAAVGEREEEVGADLVRRLREQVPDAEVLTVVTGAEVGAEASERLAARMRRTFPDLAVEVLEGGQARFAYLLGLE